MTEETFKQLAPALRSRVIATCLGCGADAMAADDVAQNVLLQLWQMLSKLDRYRSLEAIATVMARHELSDLYRSARTVPLSDEMTTSLQSSLPPPDQGIISRQELRRLDKALKSLPSPQYAVLKMRQVERRSYDEIAALMGVKAVTVRSTLARARKNLLEEFKKLNDDE